MQTFGNSCGVDEISFANLTCDVWIQTFQFDLPLHLKIGNHLTEIGDSSITDCDSTLT